MWRTCVCIEDLGVWKNWVRNLPPSCTWASLNFLVPQFPCLYSRHNKHHSHIVGMKVRRGASPAPGPGWALVLEPRLLFLSLPKESFDTWGPPLFCKLDKKRVIFFRVFFSMQFIVSGTTQTGQLLRSHVSPQNKKWEKERSAWCKQGVEARECAQDL